MAINYSKEYINPCHIWRGFLVIILYLTMQVAAEPGVGLTMVKEGNNCIITIYGVSIGSLSEGKIVCRYSTAVKIEEALIGSPVSSFSVGASIDKENRQLFVFISVTGQVNIDSTSIGILQFPLSGVQDNSTFQLLSAEFTNTQGEKSNAKILTGTSVLNRHVQFRKKAEGQQEYYLLNGRCMQYHMVSRFEKKAIRDGVPYRIYKRK